MEEREIPLHEVVRHARRLIQDIDLSSEHVFGLLVVVDGDVTRRARLDAVEARGQVDGGVFGLRLDGVEVGNDGGFARGDGDVFGAGAFYDGEWDVLGHWVCGLVLCFFGFLKEGCENSHLLLIGMETGMVV